MVVAVAVAAADVVESNSSSSRVADSSGTAVSPSFVGATQDTVVNNNNSDKDSTITGAGREALDDSVPRLQPSRDTEKNLYQKLKINTSASDVNNITNNNMTDAAKGTTTTEATESMEAVPTKSAVSQRNVDIKIERTSNKATQQLTKKVLKLDLGGKNIDEYSLKSPKSPIAARLPHQTSITSSVDVEDRKTLREALYQGIFHRHRRTIFAVGSFLRMLRSRNSQYNTIRSSSEGEDIDEQPKHHLQKLEQSQEQLQPPGEEVTTIYATSPSGQQGQSDSL
ncbi:uncharacterized protein LOC6549986 isoform X1 [Drosophila erecta]|uniref:Uncharacterized protein, isoform C n=1 Tax=Drosophila erecta TaxID=7220 RepID=A0A0Q5T620_DROER|nr:uncharacterized protein LOC6549986 isoform X1 [Drosophila erecta]KQS30605.1 uncharacterized protein Dere_GG17495, isoform C [Drosophila erecta]